MMTARPLASTLSRIALCFVPLACSFTQAASPDSTTHWTFANTVRSFDPKMAEGTRAGSQFWFVDKTQLDGRTLKMSIVAPGKATHAPHSHSEDEFFFILEGIAEFHLNGEVRRVGPYTSLYCPPRSQHGIRNAGDTELKYLVIKKYDNLE